MRAGAVPALKAVILETQEKGSPRRSGSRSGPTFCTPLSLCGLAVILLCLGVLVGADAQA
jgi:hypothetical protein